MAQIAASSASSVPYHWGVSYGSPTSTHKKDAINSPVNCANHRAALLLPDCPGWLSQESIWGCQVCAHQYQESGYIHCQRLLSVWSSPAACWQ
jgi:hypothetical protein